MIIVFYLSLFVIFYVYLGYPITVWLFGKIQKRRVLKGLCEPQITIITAAFNEVDCIEDTIRNKLDLDYPKDKFEMIVVSDGSNDGTDEVVQKYQDKGVRLIRQEPRTGKTAALNLAVTRAKGEILIFSDANSIYDLQALRKLIQNFADPSVGYVTGKMVYTDPDGTIIGDGCTAYMKYENYLRQIETLIGSVVGVDGGIDAVRKELYRPMKPDQLPDFVLPLRVVETDHRVVYDPDAILMEPSLKHTRDEYKMRVRVCLRTYWALKDMRHLLLFSKFKQFTWQIWSHKILRYFCFIFLISSYFSNGLLWHENWFYKFTFILQNAIYFSASVSPFLKKIGINLKIVNYLYYFVILNLASAHALVLFLNGGKIVVWKPRKGN